jgi:hypothetical protein
MDKIRLSILGDHLKILVLPITVLCLLALSLTGISVASDAKSTENQVMNSYEGNFSEKEFIPIDLLTIFGKPAFFFAEAVKFKAPKPGWKLNAVQLYGWDGYNGTEASVPAERVIGLEVRDKNLKLLYKFADSQLPYTNYARNATTGMAFTIEIPSIPVSDDFYVCFYDRGAIAIASERLNETSQNSFLYIEDGIVDGNELLPASLPINENTTLPINWIMTVIGN